MDQYYIQKAKEKRARKAARRVEINVVRPHLREQAAQASVFDMLKEENRTSSNVG